MSTKRRWLLWLSLLAATVFAALYPTAPESIPLKKKSHSSALPSATVATNSQVAPKVGNPMAPNHLPELTHDPFDPVAWDTPPPPPPAPPAPVAVQAVVAPPAPVEPPMPYQYMGSMKEEDGSTVVFLTKGQEGIAAHAGDSLDANYKLVSIDNNKLTIAYLPMDHLHDIALDAH
jgi:hypothetical protein